MDEKYLTEKVLEADVLTADEYSSIMKCKQDSEKYPSEIFSMKKRMESRPVKGRFGCVQRFDNMIMKEFDSLDPRAEKGQTPFRLIQPWHSPTWITPVWSS